MNYNKINNLVGWAVGLIACVVYMMTKEATVSFWDCGEFTAGAAKLEVVHSPGAPLFLMIGRFFVILFGMQNAGLALNTLSAISSGMTILFLFWTITHFAKRIVLNNNEEVSDSNLIKIMGAGVVGALAIHVFGYILVFRGGG
jgi:predicted membrane protein